MRLWLDCGKAGWLCERRDLLFPNLSEVFSAMHLTTLPSISVVGSAEVEEWLVEGEAEIVGEDTGVVDGESGCPSCAMAG